MRLTELTNETFLPLARVRRKAWPLNMWASYDFADDCFYFDGSRVGASDLLMDDWELYKEFIPEKGLDINILFRHTYRLKASGRIMQSRWTSEPWNKYKDYYGVTQVELLKTEEKPLEL